jgi:NADH-quinone oxidoreductase subunit H
VNPAEILLLAVKIVAVTLIVTGVVAYMTFGERRVLGRIQLRIGPNRAGPFGLLQPLADAVKLMSKEYLIPAGADRWLFVISPLLTMTPALVVYSLIPFGRNIYIADVNVGIVLLLAISSLGVYGVILGGWASNSKYSLLGALRSAAQMISYELSMGLSLVAVVMMAGTLSLVEIVEAQSTWPFLVKQPLGFLVFLIAGIAETNRLPFDCPEAEAELVGGYHTEYSGMGFGFYFLGEYAAMGTVSALATTLYLGGWRGPWLPSLAWFLVKCSLFIFVYYWLRGTLPRLRYDQLMALGWKVLLPAALLNILWVAGYIALWG